MKRMPGFDEDTTTPARRRVSSKRTISEPTPLKLDSVSQRRKGSKGEGMGKKMSYSTAVFKQGSDQFNAGASVNSNNVMWTSRCGLCKRCLGDDSPYRNHPVSILGGWEGAVEQPFEICGTCDAICYSDYPDMGGNDIRNYIQKSQERQKSPYIQVFKFEDLHQNDKFTLDGKCIGPDHHIGSYRPMSRVQRHAARPYQLKVNDVANLKLSTTYVYVWGEATLLRHGVEYDKNDLQSFNVSGVEIIGVAKELVSKNWAPGVQKLKGSPGHKLELGQTANKSGQATWTRALKNLFDNIRTTLTPSAATDVVTGNLGLSVPVRTRSIAKRDSDSTMSDDFLGVKTSTPQRKKKRTSPKARREGMGKISRCKLLQMLTKNRMLEKGLKLPRVL